MLILIYWVGYLFTLIKYIRVNNGRKTLHQHAPELRTEVREPVLFGTMLICTFLWPLTLLGLYSEQRELDYHAQHALRVRGFDA